MVKPGTRVLVIEDNRSIAKFVVLELKHRNFAVRCAYDGQEALQEHEDFRPELVVLDIMLPKIDGVGVLDRIRQGGDRVQVIMLIAVNTQSNKMRIHKSASLLRPPRLSP